MPAERKHRVLPTLIGVKSIQTVLPGIFPEGTPHRGYVVREMAAKTIFTMLLFKERAVLSLGSFR